jgi:hypothetical protein
MNARFLLPVAALAMIAAPAMAATGTAHHAKPAKVHKTKADKKAEKDAKAAAKKTN